MDFFQRAGNFFRGAGWVSDDERERKRREAAAAAQRAKELKAQQDAKAASMPKVLNGAGQQEWLKKNAPLSTAAQTINKQPTALSATKPVTPQQSLDSLKVNTPQNQPKQVTVPPAITPQEKQEKQRQLSELTAYGKFKTMPKVNYLSRDEYNNAIQKNKDMEAQIAKGGKLTPLEVANEIVKAPFTIGKAIVVDPIVRGYEGVRNQVRANNEISDKDNIAASDAWLKSTMDEIDRAEKAGQITKDRAKELRDKTTKANSDAKTAVKSGQESYKSKYGEDMKSQEENLWAFAEGAETLAGLGLGSLLKGGLKKGVETGTSAVVENAEKKLGRKLTEAEKETVQEGVEEVLDKETKAAKNLETVEEVTTDATKTPKAKPTEVETPAITAQKAEIDQRAIQEAERIRTSTTLTPEEKTAQINLIRDRVNEVKAKLDSSVQATQEQVAKQGDEIAQNVEAQAAVNDEVAQAQREAVTPSDGGGNPPAAANREAVANDAYVEGADNTSNVRNMDEFLTEQTRRSEQAKENPVTRLIRLAREQVYDPYAMFTKYDRKNAVGNDSIVSLMSRMLNPDQAVEVRLKNVITLPNGYKNNVWNIFKKYGKETSEKAQDFANYRMFKDELWRVAEGGQEPSLRVDPAEMAAFVQRYEAQNPEAVLDNAVLREFALRNLKERADAGIDSQAIYEASARNPFYAPRTRAVSRNSDLAMQHSGGFSTTSKSTSARTGADVAVSPLDLYRTDARNTEVGVLRNSMGENFYNRAQAGEKGFEVDVDPNVALAHREARQNFDQARTDAVELRDLRESISNQRNLTKEELGKLEKQAKATEDRAINSMREALAKAKGNRDDILNDVAERDPRYAEELKAIKEQKLPNLTPKERREQINFDIQQLNQKYPDPAITTRKELYDLAQSLDSGQFTAAELAEQATTLRQQIPDLAERLDALTGMRNQVRQNVSEADEAASQAWRDVVDTTQNATDFSGNTWTFKVDGEIGRGTAPAELAAEMARLLEFAKPGTRANLLLRGTQAVGSATKAFWTGAFAPVWQTLNVAKNFGLMLHNGKWLSAIAPNSFRGFAEGLVPIRAETRAFIDGLRARGASYENITQSAATRRMVADDIAARANIGTYLLRNPVNTLKDFYHMTSSAFTHVANAQRNAIAYQAYRRAVNAGIPEDQAMHMAVNEINNVFGDLKRVSELAQAMEPLIPYSGATQAGVRALINKAKTSPAEFALKQAAIIGGATAFTLYSLGNAKQYYQDQIDRGFTTDLDNNFVIALPGASRDEDGNWTGIVKIPLTPDFRPLNRATWRTAYDLANGQGVDVGLVAGELFNEFTGEMANSIYDTRIADEAGTPLAGVFSGSPALNTGKIIAGINPNTGKPLSDDDMSLRPRTEQAYDSTSGAARSASEMTGGALTPVQFDKLFGQLGNTGKAIKTADDPEENFFAKMFDFKGALTGGKGVTDKQRENQQYFDNIDAVERSIDPNDKVTLKAFQSLHSKKTQNQKDNMLNSAAKANQFMEYLGDGAFRTTALFDAERQLDTLQREQGKPGNPLFDLSAQELQKVLTYRSLKVANSAGQNYTKNGESAFTSLGLDEKWYQDFRDAESNYYKQLNLEGDSEKKSFSGKQEAQLSDEQRKLQDQYFALPAKSEERRNFLAANPWLKDFWAKDNEFTDQERRSLGFNSLDGDNVYDGNTGDKYGNGGGSYANNLGRITSFANDIQRLKEIDPKAAGEFDTLLKRLLAGRAGGRDKPPLGASSRGDV